MHIHIWCFVGAIPPWLPLSVVSLRKSCYICNINKCRPPQNRVPTPEEIAACKPYLLEQIRLVNPKII